MSHFLNHVVKIQTTYADDPLLVTILGVISEPGEVYFYLVELKDNEKIYINIADVSWIENMGKPKDKKKVLNLVRK